MKQSSEGDRVRIDIPDEVDIDYQYHGQHGYKTVTPYRTSD